MEWGTLPTYKLIGQDLLDFQDFFSFLISGLRPGGTKLKIPNSLREGGGSA